MTSRKRDTTPERDILLKHLDVLNQKMSEVSAESNQFAGRFLFGGVVAVIALLNTDLVVEKQLANGGLDLLSMIILIFCVLLISAVYFYRVTKRIQYFRWAYRSTKHKYEITLYSLLIGCRVNEYIMYLEEPMRKSEKGPHRLSLQSDLQSTIEYLHHHHKEKAEQIDWYRDWIIAMLIVALAVVVKIAIYANMRAGS
jgi:hypothetical protein